ncbi:MAG: hypothetical protein K8H90_06345, partial [Thermoanaerobaculia bacterium]|nr:hypothetical protein [Thermoanaerobaculia bacterium]
MGAAERLVFDKRDAADTSRGVRAFGTQRSFANPLRPAVTRFLALALLTGLTGCVPYAVGNTAATVPAERVEPSALVQIASSRRDLQRGDREGGAVLAVANEARLGLDQYSDIGVRLSGLGSVSATYKRRISGLPGQDAGAAILVGAGIVGTSHFHSEATLIVSMEERNQIAPYGGIRIQDLAPFTDGALNTPVAIGVFAGGRFGWPDLGISPELGVFYSPSPVSGGRTTVIVPSVTIRGQRLIKALGL